MKSMIRASLVVLAVGVLMISLSVISTSAAIFMKIDGIDGESSDHAHEGEIDVLSWSWGMSQAGATTGAGGGASQVVLGDIVIVKEVDKSSPKLMEAIATGKRIPNVELTVQREGEWESYLKYELKNILITSYSVAPAMEEAAKPSSSPTIIIVHSNAEAETAARLSASEKGFGVEGGASVARPRAVPTESISLNFEEIKVTYNVLHPSGAWVEETVIFDSSAKSGQTTRNEASQGATSPAR